MLQQLYWCSHKVLVGSVTKYHFKFLLHCKHWLSYLAGSILWLCYSYRIKAIQFVCMVFKLLGCVLTISSCISEQVCPSYNCRRSKVSNWNCIATSNVVYWCKYNISALLCVPISMASMYVIQYFMTLRPPCSGTFCFIQFTIVFCLYCAIVCKSNFAAGL